MNLLEQITKLANVCREEENYKLADILCSVSTDLALVESNKHLLKQFKVAKLEAQKVKKELEQMQLYKLAEELDIIAHDLEGKIIEFSELDPIESVLSSYSLIHKVANTKPEVNHTLQEILELAESDTLTYDQLTTEIKKKTLGLPTEDKKNILYILEKDHNLSIPLEKIAEERKLIKDPKSKEDKENNREIIEEIIDEYDSENQKKPKDKAKWHRSFPSSPSMWSGFAYEAVVPYQQSSQLNFWSLASEDEEKILQKIAKTQK